MKKQMKQIPNHPQKISSYWLKQWPLCLLITLTGLFYNAGMIVFPYFQGLLIDVVSSPDSKEILSVVLIYLGLILLVQISRAFKRYTVRLFASNTLFMMRNVLYENMLSERKKRNESLGTMLSHCFGDLDQCVEGMRKLTTEVFDTVFLFLFYIVYLFFYDIKMTAFSLIPVFVSILIAFLLRRIVFTLSSESRKINAELVNDHYDLFAHALLYRTYSREEDLLASYEGTLSSYEKKNSVALSLTDTMIPLSNLVALCGLFPILFYGASYVLDGQSLFAPLPFMQKVWSKGALTTYISTFVLLASKASHTAKLFFSVEKGLSCWKRVVPYLSPVQDRKPPVVRKGDTLEVSHLYLKAGERELIDDLSFVLHNGEILGITGEVSTGKSAFGRIFVQDIPYEGNVVLLGKEVRDYSFEEVKGNVTYLGHQYELMTASIKDNILLGKEREVSSLLSMVAFDEDLKTMPDKENTIIGNEGVRLSGGEQERIALARTFAHRKHLLVLDDPFASLDYKTEEEIVASLRSEAKDSMVLLMSHRLRFFKDLDHILVLHGDGTYAYGSHEELMEKDEVYHRLYTLQTEEAE